MDERVNMVADLFGLEEKIDPLVQKFIDLGKQGAKKKKVEKPAPKKKQQVTEFDDMGDWVLTMIMVALMHVNPDKSPEDVIEEGRDWARKLWQPSMKHIWRKQAMRIKRHGVRAEASKIRRELYKLL